MTDDITLPPLPHRALRPGAGDDAMTDYARAAVLLDRQKRTKDEQSLRRLLADVTCGHSLYTDDGECSDAGKHPAIDFLRDSPEQIRASLARRKEQSNG
jgi:hypothetical protein